MKLNTASQNSQATKMATDHATSTLVIYSGAVPATANDAAGTALATHTLAGFAAVSAGSVVANAIANDTIDATGTATYARISNGTQTNQLTLGLSGSGAEVIVTNTSYVAGGTSQITSLTLTQTAG
jgi:hypothetical protein